MDSLTQLAFAIHASPGAYALVLGSGVSSGAGVPTGWAIVEDSIRRVARVEDPDAADPFAWYRERFGAEAEYSGLLERLAPTPIDRRNILRSYFEPTSEERERGEKVPGRAHRAIAELVARGDVRVIVTTNFDPLSETAIREKGIHPQIISTADHVAGSVPLAHAACTVIKANGDYLDTRIRNTVGELETYDEPLARLIAQVLDEYGLLICGWSADWDVGLRTMMNAAPRRFAWYWCQRGSISATATTLIEFRRAQVIDIESTDDFFERLAGKVEALRGMDVSHPLSTAALVQEIKHYMSEDRYRIRLADSVRLETKTLVAILQGFTGIAGAYPNPDAIQDAIRRLDVACERVVALLATGFHWATPDQERLFIDAVANIIRCVTVLPLGSFYPAR